MPIRFLMLLVLSLSIGASLARSQANEPITQAWLRGAPWSARIRIFAGNEFTAIALVGGCVLLVESIRSRPRWGLGRSLWSICGLFSVSNLAVTIGGLLAAELRRVGVCPPGEILLRVVHATCTSQFLGEFAWALPAIAITYLCVRTKSHDRPDIQEASGLVFGILIVGTAFLVKLLQTLSL